MKGYFLTGKIIFPLLAHGSTLKPPLDQEILNGVEGGVLFLALHPSYAKLYSTKCTVYSCTRFDVFTI